MGFDDDSDDVGQIGWTFAGFVSNYAIATKTVKTLRREHPYISPCVPIRVHGGCRSGTLAGLHPKRLSRCRHE